MAVSVNMGTKNLRSDYMISDAELPQRVEQFNADAEKFEEMLAKADNRLKALSDTEKAIADGKFDVPDADVLQDAGSEQWQSDMSLNELRKVAKQILDGKISIKDIPPEMLTPKLLKELMTLRKTSGAADDEDEKPVDELRELLGPDFAEEIAMLTKKYAVKTEEEEKPEELDPISQTIPATLMSVDIPDELPELLKAFQSGEDVVGKVELSEAAPLVENQPEDTELTENLNMEVESHAENPEKQIAETATLENAMEVISKAVESGEISEPAVKTIKAEKTDTPELEAIPATNDESAEVKVVEVQGENNVQSEAQSEAQPKSETENEVQAKPDTENAVQAKQETENAVQPKSETENAVQPKSETENAVQPKSETENAVQPKQETKNAVQPKSETENAVQPKQETENAVQPKSEIENAVQPKLETENAVQAKPETENAVQAKPETENAVQAKPETENAVQPKAVSADDDRISAEIKDENPQKAVGKVNDRSKAIGEELEMLKNAKQKPETETKTQDKASSVQFSQNIAEASMIIRKDNGKLLVVSQKDVADQVRKLVEQAVSENREQNEYSLVLNPEELGKITVKMTKASDGAVSITIVSENARTQRLLEQNSELIQSNLRNNGVNLESWQTVNESQQNHPAQDYQGSAKNPYSPRENVPEEENDDDGRSFADIIAAM